MEYPKPGGKEEIISDFQENYGTGWIKLYRSIRKHWIYEDHLYFRAWCDILMEVNHEGKKVLIENELIHCERGEAIYSVKSWIKIFGKGWSRQKVRTFFRLLEKDSMIVTKGLRKTTKLTVVNYNTYQDRPTNSQPTANQQPTNSQPQLKNVKNYKNEKNKVLSDFEKTNPTEPTPAEIARKFFKAWKEPELRGVRFEKYSKLLNGELDKFCDYWTEPTKSGKKVKWETCNTWELGRRIGTWLSNADKQKNGKPSWNKTRDERLQEIDAMNKRLKEEGKI